MDNTEIVKALQHGLAQALDMLKYYTAVEQNTTGKKDPLVMNQIELLEKLLSYSAYAKAELEESHPLYGN